MTRVKWYKGLMEPGLVKFGEIATACSEKEITWSVHVIKRRTRLKREGLDGATNKAGD